MSVSYIILFFKFIIIFFCLPLHRDFMIRVYYSTVKLRFIGKNVSFLFITCSHLENIGVEVILENELKIPLTLSNLALLWKFVSEGEGKETCVQNEVKFLMKA